AGEVCHQRLPGSAVREHAPNLAIEYFWISELAANGEIEKLIVRNAAPQEKREARSELEIAHLVRGARRDTGRVAFGPEEELRTGVPGCRNRAAPARRGPSLAGDTLGGPAPTESSPRTPFRRWRSTDGRRKSCAASAYLQGPGPNRDRRSARSRWPACLPAFR